MKPSLLWRLWIYQGERFPVLRHGLLIAAFATAAVCLSALLRGWHDFPPWPILATAFLASFTFFLQLRIADEFKDAVTDARYRPERPVPRGLVSLKELAGVGLLTALLQLSLSLLLQPALLFLLFLTWGYMALMAKEFFISDWLLRHPLAYMVSHMMIMPIIDLFVTACDWLAVGWPPDGLGWFLLVSFCNGLVIEMGRKTWSPDMERPGVDSYSSAWGLGPALASWCLAVLASLAFCLIVTTYLHFTLVAALILGGLALTMIGVAGQFYRAPTPALAKRLENVSGLWVILAYLLQGPLPLAWLVWKG